MYANLIQVNCFILESLRLLIMDARISDADDNPRLLTLKETYIFYPGIQIRVHNLKITFLFLNQTDTTLFSLLNFKTT